MVRAPATFARFLALAAIGLGLIGAAPRPERGTAMVASNATDASRAGAEILARGGNAVDAAVAAALAAGVVQPVASGLGGGGFAVVALPDGTRTGVDFREVAPGAATRDMFRTADGGLDARASRAGGTSVAVPGESRGLAWLLAHYGTMSPKEVAAPAIRLAGGFAVEPHVAAALTTDKVEIRALLGGPVRPATTLRNPALGATLKRWAATAGEDLHTGAGARAVAAEVAGSGGVLTTADLAAYSVRERQPISFQWGDRTVITMPPPSSGGVALAQILRTLDGHDLRALGHNSSDYLHLLAEAMKHAYADRAHHLGDPDVVAVPVDRLLSDARIAEIRGAIWPGRTFPPEHYGSLIAPPVDAGTQHISVRDAHGGAVALTSTINGAWGSGQVVEPLGLILNNQMDDFAAAPGVANMFGLVGDEANAIAPGKRPLSSMTPTIVLDAAGQVELVVGGSGGSRIISGTVQVLLNVLVFGMDPQEAVSAPRVHHQWQPDGLDVEYGIPEDVARSLEGRGHVVRRLKNRSECDAGGEIVRGCPASSVNTVLFRNGEAIGGVDPRKGGWPAGIWPTGR